MAESMFLREFFTTKFEMTRIDNIRKEVKKITMNYHKYLERLPGRMRKEWEEQEARDKKEITRDSGKKKLERFIERSKLFRLKVLEDLTQEIYRDCWYTRAELEISVAIFRIGVFSEFIKHDKKWEEKQNSELKPIVLRLSKPKKPKKSGFGVKDVKYDIGEAVLTMLKPLSETFEELEKNLKRVAIIKKLVEIEQEMVEKINTREDMTEIEARSTDAIREIHEKKAPFTNYYRKLLISRNLMTQITQSVSPRVTYLDFREKLLNEQNGIS